jgi:hypothetical protein
MSVCIHVSSISTNCIKQVLMNAKRINGSILKHSSLYI